MQEYTKFSNSHLYLNLLSFNELMNTYVIWNLKHCQNRLYFHLFLWFCVYLNVFIIYRYIIPCTFYTKNLVFSEQTKMSDMFVYSFITPSLLVIEITTIICPEFLLLQRLAQYMYFDNYKCISALTAFFNKNKNVHI